MKLAEALMERADLNEKLEQLRYRIMQNVLVQEGEKSNEDPTVLMQELDSGIRRLQYLIGRINLTNCTVKIEGRTVTEVIAEKDVLSKQISIYRDIVNEAGQNTRRARGTEIKVLPTIEIAVLRKKIDDMAKRIRILDNQLQMTNWQTDLME